MRIAFLGKGGSGKTTMTTSFIKYLEKKNKEVLAIDADVNVHLKEALNMEAPYLGEKFNEIADYLENKKVKRNIPIIGTLTPSGETRFIRPTLKDPFIQKFGTVRGNVGLLACGTYQKEGLGVSCYHSKLGSMILAYNRLLDNKDFYVVSDMTAGTDSAGTSMFGVSDISIFVIEPTKKSIQVLNDYKNIIEDSQKEVYVIANKIESDSDIEFINNNVDKNIILGYVRKSNNLRKFEQGDKQGLEDFTNEMLEINKIILNKLDSFNKDWDSYYRLHKKIFIDDANEWYSEYHKQDLTKYIDEEFEYSEVI